MNKNFVRKRTVAVLLIVAAAVIMVLPQIYYKSIMVGDDISFHFNRVYDLSRQIQTGHYNYFQSIFGFNQSGRIINALYGYDLAYFLARILIVVKTWTRFQIVTSFLCYFFSGINIYILMKYLKISEKLSIILAMIYMSCALISFYALIQSFISWGGAFLPLIFIPAVKAVRDRENPINPIFLAIPVSLLIATHILSALIGVLAIVPFFLVSLYYCKDKLKWFVTALFSVGLTLIFSLNSLYGYIEVFSTNNLLKPFINTNMSNSTVMLSLTKNETRNLGLIISLIFVIQLLYALITWREIPLIEKIINGTGGLFLFISSNLVPWNTLAEKFSFLTTLQFPMRFSIIAYILLLVGVGLSLDRRSDSLGFEKMRLVKIILLTGAIISIANVNNMVKESSNFWLSADPTQGGNNKSSLYETDPEQFRSKIKDKDLTKALDVIRKGTPDYLAIADNETTQSIYSKGPYEIYKKDVMENPNNVSKKVTKSSDIELKWKAKKKDEIVLPVAIYSHSTIEVNGKKLDSKTVMKSELGLLKIISKIGENTAIVGYSPSINMKFIIIIKLLGILSCAIYLIMYLGRKFLS